MTDLNHRPIRIRTKIDKQRFWFESFINPMSNQYLLSLKDNRQQVFKKLLRLTELNPSLRLAYRDGRRAYDSFRQSVFCIEPLLYDRIKHSGEWRVLLLSTIPVNNIDIESELPQRASLALEFVNQQLRAITQHHGELSLNISSDLLLPYILRKTKYSVVKTVIKLGLWVKSAPKGKNQNKRFDD